MKTETLIGIRFELEGMHCYPNASENHGEAVKFLEFPHRHRFFFDCKKRVKHDNRDEEFILLKNIVESYVKRNLPIIKGTSIYDLGNRSCEQIAKHLLERFDFEEVQVSEDGENYAVVRKCNEEESVSKRSSKKSVKFVVGGCCSGKSTYIRENVKDPKFYIEVGAIVRKLTQTNQRVFDEKLDHKIAKVVADFVLSGWKNFDTVYIIGCRQTSVYERIMSLLDWCDREIIYLSVSEQERRKRYEERDLIKDKGQKFNDVLKGDSQVGFEEFVVYLLDNEIKNLNIIYEQIKELAK